MLLAATTLVEYMNIVQNVVLSLCGVLTVAIAYRGLTTWRKELKGKSEYTKAKEVLKAVYKVRRGFMIVRSPAMFSYEYPAEMRDESGSLKKEFAYDGTAHAYQERWKKLAEAFRELEDQTLDAEVEWGRQFQEIIIPLRHCFGQLQSAIQDMLSAKKYPYEQASRPRTERAEQRSVLYHVSENSAHDKFTSEINAAIEKFETELRPHIRK